VALALVAAVATGCAAAHHRAAAPTATTSAPPRIHENFTLLPCPRKPHTTIDIEGCAEARLQRTDTAIDGEVETLFQLVSPSGRRGFIAAERSWLAYRRRICNAESARYAGGTIQPVAFATCEVQQNLRHLDELSGIEGRLRSP
jgi:uncharacterized protein YecT (DUF1311 family)